ncbi:hypothetical protein ACFY4B_35295 [Kitasatospora sp. NPDC001261]|uniref:hypothetical protein n=1 Tax=Kitasatospora sp. NPDC001261 TaxID=3364012 RepID=UPI003692A61D
MHWHTYLWSGDGQQLKNEALRRPEPDAGFRTSAMPPMMTGWWLLKPTSLLSSTLTTPEHTVAWLRSRYADHPPPPAQAEQLALDLRAAHATEALTAGSDVVWSYWQHENGPRFLHLAAVCCPNRLWPSIPCPDPLAATTPGVP